MERSHSAQVAMSMFADSQPRPSRIYEISYMKSLFSRFGQLPNHFLVPVLSVAVAISLLLVGIGSFNTLKISHGFQQGITQDFKLQRLNGDIAHLNEVLTMSARMSAATGDVAWQARYDAYQPILQDALDQAVALAPEAYSPYAVQISSANSKLMEMEAEAFRQVSLAAPQQALAILFGDAYKAQKEVSASGMRHWSEALNQKAQVNLDQYGDGLFWAGVFSLMSFWVLMLAWAIALAMVNQYIYRRKKAEEKLRRAKHQLEQSHQALQVSKAALEQKATTLEEILEELQETEGELATSHQALQVSKAALEQKASTLEEILEELQLTQVQMVQSEKMSSLGQLVAGVAHEINNPVNFIYANLEPIGEYATDLLGLIMAYQRYYPNPPLALSSQAEAIDLDFIKQDLPKILSSMEVGAERIRQIVLSLRNFSRSDEKGLKPVDIHEGLESTLVILQHRLKASSDQAGIKILRDYDTLPAVECYPGLINQVLMNLLSNAIDALDELCEQRGDGDRGQITLKTSTFMEADDVEWVEIAIADTGIGIPEEIQGRVFDAFFTTKPVGKGTGIGLSISYSVITKKHGGRLTFFSIPRQGAEFVVQIPIAQTSLATQSTEFILQPPVAAIGIANKAKLKNRAKSISQSPVFVVD
jgi:signal transduction histidine kinase